MWLAVYICTNHMCDLFFNNRQWLVIFCKVTHLCWSGFGGIDLESGSVFLFKMSGSINVDESWFCCYCLGIVGVEQKKLVSIFAFCWAYAVFMCYHVPSVDRLMFMCATTTNEASLYLVLWINNGGISMYLYVMKQHKVN